MVNKSSIGTLKATVIVVVDFVIVVLNIVIVVVINVLVVTDPIIFSCGQ